MVGLSTMNAPALRYTHARPPWQFPLGRSGLTLKSALAFSTLRPSGQEATLSRAPRPQSSESWVGLSAALLGRREGLGKKRAAATGLRVRRGEGAAPLVSTSALCGAAHAVSLAGGRGESVSQCAHSGCPAEPLPTRLARVSGPALLPPPFGSSFPLLSARQGRTAHLSLGAQPSGLPFFLGR